MRPLLFLMVDDHPIFRTGILHLLANTRFSNARFLHANNGEEAIDIVRRESPDIIFLDIQMPIKDGFQTAREILRLKPKSNIIMLSTFDDLSIALEVYRIGAKSFLCKSVSGDILVQAIRSVLVGDCYYRSKFEQDLLEENNNDRVPNLKLTKRELELVGFLSEGMTSEEIAKTMRLSLRSVETYRFDLIKKLKVKNSTELVSHLLRCGVIY